MYGCVPRRLVSSRGFPSLCAGHPRADHRGGATSSGPEESREDQEALQPEQGAPGRQGVVGGRDVLANWLQVHDLCDFVANIIIGKCIERTV